MGGPGSGKYERLDIDWSTQPLGKEYDGTIAERLNIAASTVRMARLRLGIPAYKKPKRLKNKSAADFPKRIEAAKAMVPVGPPRALAPRQPLGLHYWCPVCQKNFLAEYPSQRTCSTTCYKEALKTDNLPIVPIASKPTASL